MEQNNGYNNELNKELKKAKVNKLKKINFNGIVRKVKEHKKLSLIVLAVVVLLIVSIILVSTNAGGIKNVVSSFNAEELEVISNKLYYEYPEDMNVTKSGNIVIINDSEEHLIGIVYSSNDNYEDKLEEIVTLYGKTFSKSAAPLTIGNIYDSEIKVSSTEKTKVAGYDSVKFVGTVKNNGTVAGWDCHVYGYTYVINDQPIMVVGLVSSKEQDAKMIKDVNELTDQIAASVSTEK